jgi:hypothetical protein
LNDYIVENPVFYKRKVVLAKVRIAEVVVESKQEDQTRRSNKKIKQPLGLNSLTKKHPIPCKDGMSRFVTDKHIAIYAII